MFKFIYEIHLGVFPLYLITSCLLSLIFGIAMSVEYVNYFRNNIHIISYYMYFLSSISIDSLGEGTSKGLMEMSKLEIV